MGRKTCFLYNLLPFMFAIGLIVSIPNSARASPVVTVVNQPLPGFLTIKAPDGQTVAHFVKSFSFFGGGSFGGAVFSQLFTDQGSVAGSNPIPTVLFVGTVVSQGLQFTKYSQPSASFPNVPSGGDIFFGLESDNGYYGYVEDNNNVIVQYAFESIANTPITTAFVSSDITSSSVPEPATLTLLGAGLLGICAARRKRAK